MVKDHSDSERGNPLPPHGLLFSINSKGSFICTIPQTGITHTTAFVTPVVEHWMEREIAQWMQLHEGSIWRPIAPWASMLLPWNYILLPHVWCHISVNWNVLIVSLNKTFPSFLPFIWLWTKTSVQDRSQTDCIWGALLYTWTLFM